jgi:phosphate transport system permease protein
VTAELRRITRLEDMATPAKSKKRHEQRPSRRLQTRRSVILIDRLSTVGITIGGIGTIIAVSAVCVFLAAVVVPLFLPGSAEEAASLRRSVSLSKPIRFGVDEYRVMSWAMCADGSTRVVRLDTGELLEERRIFADRRPTAWTFPLQGDRAAFGFDDGTVQLASIGFTTDYPDPALLPESLQALPVGSKSVHGESVVEKTPEGQLRRQRLSVGLAAPVVIDSTTAISLLDLAETNAGVVMASLSADGTLRMSAFRESENVLTGEVVQRVTTTVLPPPLSRFSSGPNDIGRWPSGLVILGAGSNLGVIWPDGEMLRYDTQNLRAPRIAERLSLTPDDGGELTVARPLLGETTLLAGDTNGQVRAWFGHKFQGAETPDGVVMSAARRFGKTGAPVTALVSSSRSRVFGVGYADGRIRLFQATSGAKIVDIVAEPGHPVLDLQITPKDDGLVAVTPGKVWQWNIDMGHPEATLGALFRPVWYESYEEPTHVWQSSGATDDFEAKLGLWPLVFGTLKATFYSMLFGAPIALLAAIFSSEFLAPALRTRIKTGIEFMASLPSVVLGFLAALVFAPFVQRVVPSAVAGFLTIPGTILVGAYVWQLLPHHFTLRFAHVRFALLIALLPIGVLLAVWLGPLIEAAFFLGNIRLWLDGNQGSGFGGWVLLLLPVAALVVAVVMTHNLGPWFRQRATMFDRTQLALFDFGRFVVGAGAVAAIAMGAAWALQMEGFDPRGDGGVLGTYVQRNSLVVGFVMGFAIIPIIYTIAEDALSAVPEHLRAASLGAGATPWQTAFRIVVPTAMSGLFSALMIGLGRAVGETMIVLMAAGNTPILDINIFNGFRTLSANIAVELPEAVKDSTHYRTLFLAALILFAMTFVINTVAEMVRLRFRKRAYEL